MRNIQKPMVSVVMPSYNAELYIKETIQSLQAQTMADWELIVIDDSSKDGTVDVIRSFAREDSRIELHINPQNMGVARSRNRAMQLCNGEYIAFLDSDDRWRPEKLEMQLDCFRKTGADLVYTSYAIVDSMGKTRCNDFIVPQQIDFPKLLKENVIGCSTVMISAKLIEKFAFVEDFYHEDYILWLSMLRSGCKAVGISQVLVDYFFHEDSKAGNKVKSAKYRWRIYRGYLGLPLLKSAWYFAHYAMAGLRKYRSV